MFELKIGEEVVNLKWGTYAMMLFTDKRGKEIEHFFEVLQEISEKLATPQKMFLVVRDMICAGYECANGKPLTDKQACDYIDECGGILSINQGQLIDYINYVIKLTFVRVTPLPGDTIDGKKKEE